MDPLQGYISNADPNDPVTSCPPSFAGDLAAVARGARDSVIPGILGTATIVVFTPIAPLAAAGFAGFLAGVGIASAFKLAADWHSMSHEQQIEAVSSGAFSYGFARAGAFGPKPSGPGVSSQARGVNDGAQSQSGTPGGTENSGNPSGTESPSSGPSNNTPSEGGSTGNEPPNGGSASAPTNEPLSNPSESTSSPPAKPNSPLPDRDALAVEKGKLTPKGRSEADTIIQAVNENKVTVPGTPRRANLDAGEADHDFAMTQNGKLNGYVEIKTPVDPKLRALDTQATDIGSKIGILRPDSNLQIIVDLKNLTPSDQVSFLNQLSANGLSRRSFTTLNER